MTVHRGRFAPSPTGDLHAGSVLAALGSWLMARRAGGTWIVRIEDVDTPREVTGAADRQLTTLAALGLASDEPVQRQSSRHGLYRAALDRLLALGAAFPCWCSRADLAAVGGIHRACVRGPAPGRRPAIRFRVPAGSTVEFEDALRGRVVQAVDEAVGDFVLFRADGLWAYQLAVVVDDAEQRISHVVRGADLLDSTPRQILLQRALGLTTPAHAHLPLLLDASGRKLSKSQGDDAIDPSSPVPALRRAWRHLGQAQDPAPATADSRTWLDAALDRFDPACVPRVDDRNTAATDRA